MSRGTLDILKHWASAFNIELSAPNVVPVVSSNTDLSAKQPLATDPGH
jgi:hypothetical protein